MPQLNLDYILRTELDGATKGFPGAQSRLRVADIGARNWNLLRRDLPLPVAVLKESALFINSDRMMSFVKEHGVCLAPHGKTTMSPQLFERQLADGAWGLTAATTAHVNVYRQAGVERVFFANQLVGEANIAYIVQELEANPTFQFYSLVDSASHVERLAATLRKRNARRRLNLLIEIGLDGGRCGVRTVEQGRDLAKAIARHNDVLQLVGVEAFEGVFAAGVEGAECKVSKLLKCAVELAEVCDREGLFDGTEWLLTAGGSTYFARVVEIFSGARLSHSPTVLLRSGCYLTHDQGIYAEGARQERDRAGLRLPEFTAAVEVWAAVQSVPEPGLAILALGKRDISYDLHLPVVCRRLHDGELTYVPGESFEITALNDQHAYMRCRMGIEPEVGDLIGLGISHPCTTFDKWKLLYVVDDAYRVKEGILTFF